MLRITSVHRFWVLFTLLFLLIALEGGLAMYVLADFSSSVADLRRIQAAVMQVDELGLVLNNFVKEMKVSTGIGQGGLGAVALPATEPLAKSAGSLAELKREIGSEALTRLAGDVSDMREAIADYGRHLRSGARDEATLTYIQTIEPLADRLMSVDFPATRNAILSEVARVSESNRRAGVVARRVLVASLAAALAVGLLLGRLIWATLNTAVAQERELVTLHRVSEKAALEANRTKDEFLATLSHELRTPLSAILGWSAMLAGGSLDAAAAPRAIHSIARSARQLAQLVDDVLDVSRIVTGSLRLDIQSVAMASVIDAAVDTVRLSAAGKGVELDVALDREGLLVAGDPARLQQIVWNLLTNAVKFTPKGGRVQIAFERVNADAQITVADTGRGITREFLPFVFDRFRQAEGGTMRSIGGLGLGLAIVRHLVELHGGRVTAESAGENLGAVFTLTLPLQAAQPDRRHRVAALRATPFPDEILRSSSPDLQGVTILIVDDDAETRELLETMVNGVNADAITAGTASEALEILDRRRPDLMICDIGMPDEDGYSLIRKIRSRSLAEGGRIPAVALTAYARSEDRRRCLLAGFHSHMAKPAEPAEMLALIASLVGRAGVVSDVPKPL